MNRPRLPRDLLLPFDLLEAIVAGAKRCPVVASAIGGALVAILIFDFIR